MCRLKAVIRRCLPTDDDPKAVIRKPKFENPDQQILIEGAAAPADRFLGNLTPKGHIPQLPYCMDFSDIAADPRERRHNSSVQPIQTHPQVKPA